MAEPVKRQYHSTRRAAAAAQTRAKIREAASALFVEQGYGATTMKAVARRAEVGERTLYDAFPTKAALFDHALGVAIVGDEAAVPVADRPEIASALEEPDPAAAIGRFVAYSADLLDRAGDLIMVSVESAGADPDMRTAADAGSKATHQVCLALAANLEQRGALGTGLDATTAADVLYALCSPHMHQLLRRHRAWTADQYRDWLATAARTELLG